VFKDIVILDLTSNVAGPFCTQMFAYYNAEVIKVEKVGVGDDSRYFAPFINGESVNFKVHNRGKKSIALDLKSEKDKSFLFELVKKADVFIESFRPGIMSKLGFDYETLKKINPSIIMCSISAFGQSGELSQLPGYDIIAQAMSGMMSLTGLSDGMPMKTGPSIADYMGGVNAFGGISAALYKREYTGEGDWIDISLVDCLIAANDYYESAYIDGYDATRTGNHHSLIAPYGVFKGTGGSVVIGAVNDNIWFKLVKLIGDKRLQDEGKFKRLETRINNLSEIIEVVEEWLSSYTGIEEPIQLLQKKGIPCAPVLNCGELDDVEHFRNRGIASSIVVDEEKGISLPARGMHLKFFNSRGSMGKAPKIGENYEEIFKKYIGEKVNNFDRN
jgi:crotonobetainyl-CoA:carnitine CoA-transferase CaiB-like acyl-CoA transferase